MSATRGAIIQQVRQIALHHAACWTDKSDTDWYLGLLGEVHELWDALRGIHEHPTEYELLQIASICVNWLARLDPTQIEVATTHLLARDVPTPDALTVPSTERRFEPGVATPQEGER